MGGSISIASTVSSCHSRNGSCIRSSSSSSSSSDSGGNGLGSPAVAAQTAHAAAEKTGRSGGGGETVLLKAAGGCCYCETVGRENCDTTCDGRNNFSCHFLDSSCRNCNCSGSRDESCSSISSWCNATSIGSGASSIASVGSSIYSSSINSTTSSRSITSSSSSRSSSSSSLVDKVPHRLLASDTDATAQRILDLARRQRSGISASSSSSSSSPAGNECRCFSRIRSASSLSSSSAALSYAPQPPTAARLEECYVMGKQLGRGHVGMVRLCEEIATGNTFACKTVLRSSVKQREGGGSDVDELFSEVLAMLGLRSAAAVAAAATSNAAAAATSASRRREAAASGPPAVAAAVGDPLVQLHEVFVDDVAVHLILDHCAGGDLLDHVMGRQGLSEREAARILGQIAAAVAKMHVLGFVHRDLKPENMLVVQPASALGRDDDIAIKIADFGLCVRLNPGQSAKGFVGSPHYMAPEVVSGQPYGQEVDVWGMGVTLFASLSGRFPFAGNSHDEIYAAVLEAQLDFAKEPWPRISHQAKDLIRRMLQPDPSRRISAMDVLSHPWVLQHCVGRPSTAPPAAASPAADSASAATLQGRPPETTTPVAAASPAAVPAAAAKPRQHRRLGTAIAPVAVLGHEAESGQAGGQRQGRQPGPNSRWPSHTSTSFISQKQLRVCHARLPHDSGVSEQAPRGGDEQSDGVVDARQCMGGWDTSDRWRRYRVGTPFVEPLHLSGLRSSPISSQPSPTSSLDPIPSLESPTEIAPVSAQRRAPY